MATAKPTPNGSEYEKMTATERVAAFGITDSETATRAFDAERHEELAAESKGEKIGGYTEDELRDMLRKNGSVPSGILYNPYSRTPFVALPDSAHDEVVRRSREFDASGSGPVATVGAAAEAAPVDPPKTGDTGKAGQG